MKALSSVGARLPQRLRSELRLLLLLLLLGLSLVPLAVFYTGQYTLGPYRDGAGFGVFLVDYYAGLWDGRAGTWILALGPLLLVLWLRGLGWLWRRKRRPAQRSDADLRRAPHRREPTLD